MDLDELEPRETAVEAKGLCPFIRSKTCAPMQNFLKRR